jgi:hypothetical protein
MGTLTPNNINKASSRYFTVNGTNSVTLSRWNSRTNISIYCTSFASAGTTTVLLQPMLKDLHH